MAPAAPQGPLSRALVTLIAVATGAVVANLYYAQPLLHRIAGTFGTGPGLTSWVITATQVGYAAGLLLVVPLGDLHPRRTLVVRLFCFDAVALVASALAPSLWVFTLASLAVGALSVAGQVMIPFAADLAPEERRGRVVARIMTGLLLGILLARTVSGFVAQVTGGWRGIYWLSAGLMLCFALILWRALPAEGPSAPHVRLARRHVAAAARHRAGPAPTRLARRRGLRRLQRPVDHARVPAVGQAVRLLLRGHRPLRPLRRRRDHRGQCGGEAGRLGPSHADHGRGRRAADRLASPCCWAGRSSLAALIAGIVVLDMGTQGMQITNQAIIYALRPDARSRITSAYMVCYFIGGAIGSVTAGTLYDTHGWAGVCLLGAGFGVLTLALSAYEWVRPLPAGRSAPDQPGPQQAAAPDRPGATAPTTTEA